MEYIPHAPTPERPPTMVDLALGAPSGSTAANQKSAVPRRARSHDATRSYEVGRTARHDRVTRRNARVDPPRRLPHDHVPPDQPRLALRHL